MPNRQLSDVLDRCLILLTEQELTVEECLERYPQHAAQLGPLLEMALELRHISPKAADHASITAGKHRMLAALAEKRRRQAPQTQPADESPFLSGLRRRIGAWLPGDAARDWRRAPGLQTALAGAVVLVLLIVAGALLLPSWLGPDVAQMATVERITGTVEVQVAGSQAWQPAAAGQPLEVGTRVRTAALSAAQLIFFDGSTTVLEADTELALGTLIAGGDGRATTILLDQPRGRTHHRVVPLSNSESRFEVRSPVAVMLVRGTEFVVVVEQDGTTGVTVREGLVQVQAKWETIELQPGWATSVGPLEPPATPYAAPLPPSLEELPFLREERLQTATSTSAPTRTPSSLSTDAPRPTLTSRPEEAKPSPPAEAEQEATPLPATATATLRPTVTPEPTLTPEPTATPPIPPTSEDSESEPTAKPQPTRTPQPTATPPVPPTSEIEQPDPTETPPVPPPSEQDAGGSSGPSMASPSPTASSDSQAAEQDRRGSPEVVASSADSERTLAAEAEELVLQPVGGATLRRGALALLAPWLTLGSALVLVGVSVALIGGGSAGT